MAALHRLLLDEEHWDSTVKTRTAKFSDYSQLPLPETMPSRNHMSKTQTLKHFCFSDLVFGFLMGAFVCVL